MPAIEMPGYGVRTEPYEPPDQDGEDEECRACKMWGILQDGFCRACRESRDEAEREAAEEARSERAKEQEGRR